MRPLLEALSLFERLKKQEKLRGEIGKRSPQLLALIAQAGLVAAVAYHLEKSEVFSKPSEVSKEDKLAYLISVEPLLRTATTEERSKKLVNLTERLLRASSHIDKEVVKNTINDAFKDLLNLTKRSIDYVRVENLALQYAIHLKRVFEAGGERI